MGDDSPPRNDPLMSVHSTDTPGLSDDDTGSKWFALLLLGFFLLSFVLVWFLFTSCNHRPPATDRRGF